MHAILSTLMHKARAVYYHGSVHDKVEFLRDTFRQNGYSNQQICRALSLPLSDKPDSITFLLYVELILTISDGCCRHIPKLVGLEKLLLSFGCSRMTRD
jgi:hypothetical protein